MGLLSHVDVRVRHRDRAQRFYDALFAEFGAVREDGPNFTTYQLTPEGDWFGITEEASPPPGATRIALRARDRAQVDRVAALLRACGSGNVEMDDGMYGPGYYAVFFEDPDGNALEVCFVDS
jgi:catechol 2,3-dioxygenase-like lactoylglutathione lyase family enzyme